MRSHHRKVIFAKNHGPSKVARPTVKPHRSYHKPVAIAAQSSDMPDVNAHPFAIPEHLSSTPLIKDALSTATSSSQQQNVQECLPLLRGRDDSTGAFDFNQHGVLRLDRSSHVEFLIDNLGEFPAQFVGVDASRPWMVYWGLMGLHLLGEDATAYSAGIMKTFTPMQNATGGFGGGQGQYSHLAGSYATILSIATAGTESAFSMINRETMWLWLGRLKQADGGFRLCESGEEDVRGAYCAMVILSLLNLSFELPPNAPARQAGMTTFGDGLGEYISRCQTYEGGISGAPGNEAHGAYTFCALACLCLLGEPHVMLQRYLDIPLFVSWLSSRQYSPEGGFAGRTNKLVDGCYCHWAGGCWPLIEAALNGPQEDVHAVESASIGNLSSTEGHTRYVLNCCQADTGGLRDKPAKRPDSYHTCYTLAGLSSVQHLHYYQNSQHKESAFASAFTWQCLQVAEADEAIVFDETDRLTPLHPVYVIPYQAVSKMRRWAEHLR